ncbi:MAG TPA: hypothetical protein VKU38_07860 [Ktedonobacteraceae bacterium]|nr:hypothetical protein [Ktedonobacteraceae bacterium]
MPVLLIVPGIAETAAQHVPGIFLAKVVEQKMKAARSQWKAPVLLEQAAPAPPLPCGVWCVDCDVPALL